jgi:diamine N-acetyltransferase
VITYGLSDRVGRIISLRAVEEENWRAIADIAPRDDQLEFVAPLAAHYLLLSTRENDWTSLGVYADERGVGHVMWAVDDDRSQKQRIFGVTGGLNRLNVRHGASCEDTVGALAPTDEA